MLTETEVIVLRGVRYSDSASIIQTYSDHLGSLSFRVSRPSRRSMAGGMRAFFVPLSLLSVSMEYHPNREIQLPREVTPISLLSSASVDPIINAEVLFSSELLSRLLRAQGMDRELFGYLRRQICDLEVMEPKHAASFHLRLMAGLCYHLGVLPECDGYRPGYVLDVRDGHFRPPISSIELSRRETTEVLVRLFTDTQTEELPMNRQLRNALMEILLEYLGFHFSELGQLRSPSVLTELFG